MTPAFDEGWIGGPCTTARTATSTAGFCATAGGASFCSLPCTTAAPYCPDRTGSATTFCVERWAGVGGCVAQGDAEAPICLDGQACVPLARFGQTAERTVCR